MSVVAMTELNVFEQLAALGTLVQQQYAEMDLLSRRLAYVVSQYEQLYNANQELMHRLVGTEPVGKAEDCKPSEAGSIPVVPSESHDTCTSCNGAGYVGHESWGIQCPIVKH